MSILDILPESVMDLILTFLRWQPCIHRAVHSYFTNWTVLQQNMHCSHLLSEPYYVIKEQCTTVINSDVSCKVTPEFFFSKKFSKNRALNIFTYPWTNPQTSHFIITQNFKLIGAPIDHFNCSEVLFQAASDTPLFIVNCQTKTTKVIFENVAFNHLTGDRSGIAIYVASIGGEVLVENCSFNNCAIVCANNNK